MRAMNAKELTAVFGGASGIEALEINAESFRVDPSLQPQCPSEPQIWPGDPSE